MKGWGAMNGSEEQQVQRPWGGLVGRLCRTRYQKGNQAWDLGSWDQEVVSLGPCKWGDEIVACSFCVVGSQVANTRSTGRIQPSTLFYPAWHLVSTWWQHRALA